MHRIIVWFGVVYLLYISKEIHAFECTDDSDFICSSEKKCIRSEKICDKVKDCTDGSDEEDCDCLAPDWYLCEDGKTCLSHSQVCDGSFDCPIHEDDERNCTGSYVPHHEKPECTDDEFTCISDGFCIPLEMACDGVKQCMDGSDEKVGCSDVSKRCSGFLCKNGRCLTDTDWVCDRHNDCGDNSDEPQNCTYNCELSKGRFLCNDHSSCIPLNDVCNGKRDCPKGDDESSSCPFAKEECNSNRCPKEAKCHYLPSGSVCICPKGYHYNATSTKCEDVNECLTYGICSHGCVNTQGGYQCICAKKFVHENGTCVAASKKDAILVYAASSSVNIMTLNSHHIHRVADNLNQVVGICYNDGYIYWTDISKQVESVMRSRILGRPEIVFSSGLGKPEDITVDYVTGNIYFSDYDHQHIAVCSNDARYCKALITVNVHRPRGVVLYTLKGQMFWSDWGARPMIGTASMDGKSAKPFISDDIHWPNGLALDWPNKRLYWVDAKLKLIESCKLDGSDRRAVIKHVSKHPYGITVFEDKLYWSDWNSKSIQSCNKFTGKNRTTVIRDKMIYDIHIYHSAMKGVRENPCDNAPCTHLCLLNANATYTCECPKYWELSSDNHTCMSTEKRKILLLGMGNRFVLVEHQSFGRHNDAEGKIVQFNIDKMAYNSLKGNVLVADNKDKVIYEVEPKSFASRKLLTDNIGNITAMAFDNFANTLYWADAERSTIEVYSFNTQHRAIVHHYMGGQEPIGLAILPENGKLYAALRSKKHTYIDMMPSNGHGPHYHLLKDELGEGPINMLPDHNLREIFMTDHEHSSITYMSFSGDVYHSFLHDVDKPVSLAVIGDELFWSTSKSLVLNWTPTSSMTGTKSMVIKHPITLPVPDVIVLQTITTVKMSKHPCVAHNHNGCSHLCVAMSATIASCLCPNGMVFNDSSNTTCINSGECFFRCGSGECISEAERCNSKYDCADHTDESNCPEIHKTITCSSPDDFICDDNSKCIDRNARCDGKLDCDDRSDEDFCDKYNPKAKCHERQFMCYDGTCIAQDRLCDGFKDCASREDELRENCETYGTCAPGEFRCDNGQCILDSWVCDDAVDCKDSSDEKHCNFAVECATEFRKCDDGSCLHENVWCDGITDCNDRSDERNCTDEKVKEAGEAKKAKEAKDAKDVKEVKSICDVPKKFKCKSDKLICLDDSQLCNGKAECPNGEDEANCRECTIDQFECEKNECIPIEKRCDSHTDCKNEKDEMGCDQSKTNSFHGERDVSKSMGDILMIFALVVATILVACAVVKLGIIAYQKYRANAATNLIVYFKNGTADITTMTLNTSDDTIKLLP